MVGDVIEAAQWAGRRRYLEWEAAPEGYLADAGALESRWYVRCGGSWQAAAERFPRAEFLPEAGCVFLTPAMSGTELRALTEGLPVLCALRVLE